jgi:hypothetical protein
LITIDTLESLFERMRNDGIWNVDGDLLWGYFFTDPDPEKLNAVAVELVQRGYRYVDLFTATDEILERSGEQKTYFLHVERVETHTPVTLNQRNAEFYVLAERFEIESYDGMDVGPVK